MVLIIDAKFSVYFLNSILKSIKKELKFVLLQIQSLLL